MLAVSSGRRQRPEEPPGGKLEKLGHDPRAALALVKLGEFEDGRPDALISGAGEVLEKLSFESAKPRAVRRQPVASAAHQGDGPFQRRFVILPDLSGRPERSLARPFRA